MDRFLNFLTPTLRVDDPLKLTGIFGAFFAAIILVSIFTPITMKLAPKLGIVDKPDGDRHLHEKETPVLGGLAIYAAFLLAFLLSAVYRYYYMEHAFSDVFNPRVQGILLGSTVIMVIGIIDDKYGMKAKLKFLLQIVAASILVLPCFGVQFTIIGANELGFLGSFLTVVWVVVICNMINLMDGLDGLAAGIVAIAAITFLIISLTITGLFGMAILAAILAGVTIGFLFYNFNPAKTFMGDSGALFLGYIIASLSVLQNWKVATVVALSMPILVLSVPVCDITFAVIRRLLNGKSPFTADRGHLHHRLLDSGLSQRRTVLIIYAITTLGCIIALYFFSQTDVFGFQRIR